MKIFNIKTITFAMCLTATSVQASTLTLSADSNPNPNVEQYQFTNTLTTGTNFSDILNFTVTPNRNLFASISGTDNVLIKFTSFDLYSGSSTGVNSLVAIGEVVSPAPQLSFGSLIGTALANNYFIKIEGIQQQLSSYNGNVSLFQPSAVPVPAALPLMLSAAGLFGFARRYRNK